MEFWKRTGERAGAIGKIVGEQLRDVEKQAAPVVDAAKPHLENFADQAKKIISAVTRPKR